MKNFIFSFLMLILATTLFGQGAGPRYDPRTTIFGPETDSTTILAMGLSPYEEKLVTLAWQNYPSSEIYHSRVKIAEKKINLERFSWTDDIRASFNFNQRNIEAGLTSSDANANTFYPWYNFGVGVTIGSFVQTPIRVSIAKEELDIANASLDQHKLSIRAEVLKRYKDYQLKLELLKIRTQAVEDAYSTHLLITRDFEKGAATLEEFIKSAAAYNAATEAKLVAETNIMESKITLEEMIGIKLEEVGN